MWATQLAEELKYVGTLCVEFFIDRNENLYVNEIAPRVHNSGHLTINAYNISQFENHIRAVCSLEKKKNTYSVIALQLYVIILIEIASIRAFKYSDEY